MSQGMRNGFVRSAAGMMRRSKNGVGHFLDSFVMETASFARGFKKHPLANDLVLVFLQL